MAYPNLTITFLIQHDGRYLLIERGPAERNFPGLWAFPGGKVEEGETVVDTIRREVREETSLELTDLFIPLNSYCFGGSVGLAFLVQADSDRVSPNEFAAFKWVSSLEDLAGIRCIPGIFNHLVDALRESSKGHWRSLEEFRLTQEKYLNT
jgi:8-oxo-dGTP pyrophosphatase MutT (NUDIX family)